MSQSPKINLVNAVAILTKSGLPGADWVINPYNGCLFGCMYCYAAQIARWKHPDEKWGTYLDVKINASEVLKKDLERLAKKEGTRDFGEIFFSSVTDPYVGLEAKYKITRQCLETLRDFGYEGNISIQTKSPLVIRDIDILKQLKKVIVGFTITALDDEVSQFLEVNAPTISSRLIALEKLHKAGINTYVFVGPLLPHVIKNKDSLAKLLDKLESVGVKEVWFEHINLSTKIKNRLYEYLEKKNSKLIEKFEIANTQEYRDELDKIITEVMKDRKLRLGLGQVIHHKKLKRRQ